jgi:hypothetical protein
VTLLKDLKGHLKHIIEEKFKLRIDKFDEDFDLNNLMQSNISEFTLNTGINLDENLLTNESFRCMILFKEYKKIQEEIDRLKPTGLPSGSGASGGSSKNIKLGNQEHSFSNFKELGDHVVEWLTGMNLQLIKSRTIKPSGTDSKKSNGKSKGQAKKTWLPSTLNEEMIGFVAEMIAYKSLIKEFGEENVEWKSENAFLYGFLQGKAGFGYDIELADDQGVRYIEVKGVSSWDLSFKMKINELNKAAEFSSRYDILIVENPLSENFRVRYFKSPFKLKKGESLLSNSKFKISNDTYLIKFALDQE